jgi:hypothetical protein
LIVKSEPPQLASWWQNMEEMEPVFQSSSTEVSALCPTTSLNRVFLLWGKKLSFRYPKCPFSILSKCIHEQCIKQLRIIVIIY